MPQGPLIIVEPQKRLMGTGLGGLHNQYEVNSVAPEMADVVDAVGVAKAGEEIATRPFQLVTGRTWRGSAFGGVKGRTELPGLVDDYLAGKLQVDAFHTHSRPLAEINEVRGGIFLW